jgi:hypothetical protein
MANTDLEVIIRAKDQASPTIDRVTGSVTKLDKETDKATTTTGGLWKSFAAGALITDELSKSIKMSISAEESHSKFLTVFKDVADKASASAKDLSTNWGLSKNAAEVMLSSTGDLLTGLGMTGEEALKLSDKTQKLAIDLASFTNFSGGAEGASLALTKAMLGEREGLKALGKTVSEEMVKDELLRVGKDKLTGQALLQAKAEATLAVVIAQSSNAIGDYARTSESTANVLKRFEQKMNDLRVAVGDALVKVILPYLKQFAEWFEANKEQIVQVLEDIIGGFADVAKVLMDGAKWVWEYKDAIIGLGIGLATYFIGAKVVAIVSGIESITAAMIAGKLVALPYAAAVAAIMGAYVLYKKSADLAADSSEILTKSFISAAIAQGVSLGEINKLTREYNFNTDAMLNAIFAGKEGVKLQTILKDVSEKRTKALRESYIEEEKAKKSQEELKKVTETHIPIIDKHKKAILSAAEAQKEQEKRTKLAAEAFVAEIRAIEDLFSGLKAIVPELENGADATDTIRKSIDEYTQSLIDNIKKQEAAASKLSETYDGINRAISTFRNGLDSLGIDLGGTANKLLDTAQAGLDFMSAMATGSIWDKISAGINLAVTAIGALVSLFKGDGVGEAIKRENAWMKLTAEQIEKLRELEKQYGSTHAATSAMLGDIIADAEVTRNNFDMYADRVRGILSDLDQGKMTAAQVAKSMGDAFTSLIAKAKALGTEGSKSLITMYRDLESRGIRVKEVQEYINAEMERGLEGYKKMKDAMKIGENATEAQIKDAQNATAMFGNQNIKVYEDMIRYQDLLAANPAMINAIDGATQALIGLSNTTELTQQQYDDFQKSAGISYDKLMEQGFSSKEALQALAPMLARLKFLHNEYGLEIDATTQALLDEADAQGVNTDQAMSQADANQRICDSLDKLVEIFGGKLPDAIDKTTKKFKELGDTAANVKYPSEYGGTGGGGYEGGGNGGGGYEGGGKRNPDEYAAGGWFSPRLSQDTLIQAHMGERVEITPAGKKSGGISVTQNIIINGTNLDKDSIIMAIKTAIPNNANGLKTVIKQAMAEGY